MKALILAASQGKNLYPFSETTPKCLLNIGGEKIITRLIRQFRDNGIREFVVVVGNKADEIKEQLGHGSNLDVSITYVTQEKRTGIGDAISLAEPNLKLETNFYLVYGDVILGDIELQRFFGRLSSGEISSLAAVAHTPTSGNFTPVYLDNKMRISRVGESKHTATQTNYVIAGLFYLPNLFLEKNREFLFDVLKSYEALISKNQLAAAVLEDNWIDVNYSWDLLRAQKIELDSFRDSIISEKAIIDRPVSIRGAVRIGKGSHICAGATLIGPCVIGEECYIGNNTLIRPYSIIGDRSRIGGGAEIKNSTISNDCEVGRLAYIGDSILGKGVKFGSSTNTINIHTTGESPHIKSYPVSGASELDGVVPDIEKIGAIIGDFAKIGSGHQLPPGSLIAGGTRIGDNFSL